MSCHALLVWSNRHDCLSSVHWWMTQNDSDIPVSAARLVVVCVCSGWWSTEEESWRENKFETRRQRWRGPDWTTSISSVTTATEASHHRGRGAGAGEKSDDWQERRGTEEERAKQANTTRRDARQLPERSVIGLLYL